MDSLPSLMSVDHAPVTTPSSNPSMFYDRNNLRCEERFMPIKKRRIATLEEEDDQEIQKFNQEKLATENNNMIKKPKCLLNEEDNNKNKKKKMPKKMERGPVVNDDSTERLKRFITGEMYGLDMKLVIQKTLYESDMKKELNRLNMPIKQLETPAHGFLTADEIRIIDESKEGIEVKVVGPTMRMFKRPLWLKKWHMKHTDNYVLKTNWNEFAADNKMVLKEYTMIQVWSFRKDRQLCFAIVPVERPDAVNDAA